MLNIVSTYSWIYKSNSPITFSLEKTFGEMSMKWLLLNFFVFQKVPLRTSVINKSTPNFFSTSSVLFMAGLASKKVICLQISHLDLLQGPQKPSLVLSGGTLALTRMSFKHFPLLKHIIGTLSKFLQCSLSGVRRRWIW